MSIYGWMCEEMEEIDFQFKDDFLHPPPCIYKMRDKLKIIKPKMNTHLGLCESCKWCRIVQGFCLIKTMQIRERTEECKDYKFKEVYTKHS